MSLEKYKDKRDFEKTPEPGEKPQKAAGKDQLLFVIHKHFASHLHFDLRLELDGVLKSWAIPKGPTINPKEKKLAVMVEDHPLEYIDFEGVIPDGNYGAGQVYVWDSGTYHALDTLNAKDSSEKLRDGLEKGHLTFILEGKILKGEYALIRLKKASPKDWLLIKKNDSFAKDTDITQVKAPGEIKKKLQ
ncbi:MAG: 3'-phosphoesterase [Actinobacteria bacterium]|nr:3'-phosphoesterase [Actinomycetota bacterium]